VFPLVAIAREIRRIYPVRNKGGFVVDSSRKEISNGVYPKKDLNFYYLGPKDELSRILLSQEDFVVKTIISGKIRRYFSARNIADVLFKIPFGTIQSFFLLLIIKPDLVFSKGGAGSFGVAYSANMLKIPVFLHESDIVPGLSNQKTAKWAKKIFVSFPKTDYFDSQKTILTGNPIRSEVLNADKGEAGETFSLTFSKPVFLVMGGSQGAEAINDFILSALNKILLNYEVIHVAGRENFMQVKKEADVVIDRSLGRYYHLFGFLDERKIGQAYAAADLIISRAGSGSVFEIAAVGKPSILIPLPSSAGNHQSKNAYAYSDAGACLVFEQENLTEALYSDLEDLKIGNGGKKRIIDRINDSTEYNGGRYPRYFIATVSVGGIPVYSTFLLKQQIIINENPPKA